MRWLLSAHGASPFGAERVLLAMAGALAARGHAVTLELPHEGPALELARGIRGIDVWVSGRARLPRNTTELLRYLAGTVPAYRKLYRRLRERDYDIVWVQSIYNPLAAIAAHRAGVPTVWHLQERNLPYLAGWILDRVIRYGCDRAVAISDFVRRSFPACADRLVVTPNALLRSIPALDPKRDGPFTVLYIGQLEPRKRAPDVVAAVASVPECRLVLVGHGKAAGQLEAAVRRAGLEARVELAGLQLEIVPYLAACDCVVIPSRDEPFGLVALEAMAARRPVIAARSGALPEVLGDAALYYPLGDARKLAEQIRRLREDPALAEDLRARGLDRVRAFALGRMIDAVEAHAADLLRAVAVRREAAAGDTSAARMPSADAVAGPARRAGIIYRGQDEEAP